MRGRCVHGNCCSNKLTALYCRHSPPICICTPTRRLYNKT